MKILLTILFILSFASVKGQALPNASYKNYIDKIDPNEILIEGNTFKLSYDEKAFYPSWAFIELGNSELGSNDKVSIGKIKTADGNDYYHSGYASAFMIDTLHLIKGSEDYKSLADYKNTFPLEFNPDALLNDLNAGIHSFVIEKRKVPERYFLIEGLVKGKKGSSFGYHEVQVPDGVFLILLVTAPDLQFKSYIAFYIPQTAGGGLSHFRYYACTISDIEKLSGFKLFSGLTAKQKFIKTQFFIEDFASLMGIKPNADDLMGNQMRR